MTATLAAGERTLVAEVENTMNNHDNTELDLVGCPECGAPAEVVDRAAMQSTDGPVEHVKVHCVSRHWFWMPTESLPVLDPTAGGEPHRWTSPRH